MNQLEIKLADLEDSRAYFSVGGSFIMRGDILKALNQDYLDQVISVIPLRTLKEIYDEDEAETC